jgi:vesicle transport through interaction with t-SNAREs protein 1
LRKVELELDEADDIVRIITIEWLPLLNCPPQQVSQLEVEIQGIPQSIKAPYATRLKQAKADLTKYKKLSKESHSQASRAELLRGYKPSGSNSDDPYGERSDRTRLLVGTETLSDGSRRITESTTIALETETHGADILRTLQGQREQIENSRNMVRYSIAHRLASFLLFG